MKKLILITTLSIFLLPLMAQIEFPRPNLNPYSSNGGNSLLNLEKLSMSHSMGFEAGTSSTGYGYYLSRYTNHLKYNFNPKLELDLDLNFVNVGGFNTSSKFEFNNDNSSRVIPEYSLSYKPRDNVQIQCQMLYGPYLNPYKDSWYRSW